VNGFYLKITNLAEPINLLCMKCFLISIIAAFFLLNHAAAQTGYSFGVRITGHGKPMILIPGNKGSADTYNEVVAHYKDHYKCYVITLAGFAGQPPSGAHDHLLQEQRDEIIRYIIQNNLHKPVLVCFSFGAGLGLWIACTRPDLIGPIVDLDGTPFDAAVDDVHLDKDSLVKADGARYEKALTRTAEEWRKRDSIYHSPAGMKEGFEEVQKLVSDTNRNNEIANWDKASDFKSSVLMNLEADTLDLRQQVARISSPILLLGSWKGWDNIKTKQQAEQRYAAQFTRAKNLTMIFSENGKHFLMWEDFDWMVTQMDAFLRKYH
jgi:pimeloyl-ACP methyl ester carboxylesterase